MLSNLLRLFDTQKARYPSMNERTLSEQHEVASYLYYDGTSLDYQIEATTTHRLEQFKTEKSAIKELINSQIPFSL